MIHNGAGSKAVFFANNPSRNHRQHGRAEITICGQHSTIVIPMVCSTEHDGYVDIFLQQLCARGQGLLVRG